MFSDASAALKCLLRTGPDGTAGVFGEQGDDSNSATCGCGGRAKCADETRVGGVRGLGGHRNTEISCPKMQGGLLRFRELPKGPTKCGR